MQRWGGGVCAVSDPPPVLLQVIPLLLQLVNRVQGVRSMAAAGGDGAAMDEAKRQAKRQKTRRT